MTHKVDPLVRYGLSRTFLWEFVCDTFPLDTLFTTVQVVNRLHAEGRIAGKGPYSSEYAAIRLVLHEWGDNPGIRDFQKTSKGKLTAWVLPRAEHV